MKTTPAPNFKTRPSPKARVQFSGIAETAIEAACLTVAETARYLRISEQTVRQLCREEKLPVVRPVPRRILIVRKKLDEMIMHGTLGAKIVEPPTS